MHVKFFIPILNALQSLGGSGSPSEVKDALIETLRISEKELEERYKSGATKIDNQINWSKVYLSRSGLVDTSDRNVWSLTEKGLKAKLTDNDVIKIFREIHNGFVTKRKKTRNMSMKMRHTS